MSVRRAIGGLPVKSMVLDVHPSSLFEGLAPAAVYIANEYDCDVFFRFNGHDYVARPRTGAVSHHCGGGDLRGGKFPCSPLAPRSPNVSRQPSRATSILGWASDRTERATTAKEPA